MPSYQLEILEDINHEVAHYYNSATQDKIFSTAGQFIASMNGINYEFNIQSHTKMRGFEFFRLTRRAFRLDKSNAVFNFQKNGIVVLRRGAIYFYDLKTRILHQTGQLKMCRNVLHSGIAVTETGIYFGEYGSNTNRDAVPVWRSKDDGRSWHICYEFPAGTIKHIHGVYQDRYSGSLWVPTGDFVNECFVAEAKDPDFSNVVIHGDGTQNWRAVSMLFEPESIYWAMDSQLETSYLQQFNRSTGRLQQHRHFPGPVWYSKRLEDGITILQTTVEVGDGVKSDHAMLYASSNLTNWTKVASFRKDRWPMRYFKFGVIAFADGPQTSVDFLIFGEALQSFDGKIKRARVKRI